MFKVQFYLLGLWHWRCLQPRYDCYFELLASHISKHLLCSKSGRNWKQIQKLWIFRPSYELIEPGTLDSLGLFLVFRSSHPSRPQLFIFWLLNLSEFICVKTKNPWPVFYFRLDIINGCLFSAGWLTSLHLTRVSVSGPQYEEY